MELEPSPPLASTVGTGSRCSGPLCLSFLSAISSGMFFDDDGEDSFGGGMDLLNQREVDKTALALSQLEEKLYGGVSTVQEDEAPEVEDEYRRFEAAGYSAHTDSVEAREIQDWQRAFPYLRVEGKSLTSKRQGPFDGSSDDIEGVQVVPMPADTSTRMDLQPPLDDHPLQEGGSLAVVGSRCPISRVTRVPNDSEEGASECQGEEEEIFAQHGILEELLLVDSRPSQHPESAPAPASALAPVPALDPDHAHTQSQNKDFAAIISSDPVSPHLARRAEVVSILADAVWPDLVAELRPLVQRVVRASRAVGLQYPSEAIGAEGQQQQQQQQQCARDAEAEAAGWAGAGEFEQGGLDDSGW